MDTYTSFVYLFIYIGELLSCTSGAACRVYYVRRQKNTITEEENA